MVFSASIKADQDIRIAENAAILMLRPPDILVT
jgi:hypothetical protein